jgi:hypothetical protein
MTEARVILAVAAEADDDFIWTRLGDIQSNMFAAGPVSIKFPYFGREGSLERRPFMSTRWATHAGDMQALIDHARDRCVCGCYVNIGDVLVEALRETEQGSSIQAVVIIGDHFHGNRDDTLVYAKRLRAVGTRLFLFQQRSPTSVHNDVFKALAETTHGAYFEINPAIERIAERLPRLLEAVAHYAIGGTDALEALANHSAGLLLEQIN